MRPALAKRLAGFGLETVGDLLTHYPRRYEDFTDRKAIADLKVGEEATVRATVERVTLDHGHRRRVTLLKAVLRDQSGIMIGVWFNQPWLAKVLEPGMVLSLRGGVRLAGGGASFVVKAHEILAGEGETVHTEGIVPVYPASESISTRVLRDLVHEVRRTARSVPDPLSGALRAAERLPAKADAVLAIHAPRSHPEARRGARASRARGAAPHAARPAAPQRRRAARQQRAGARGGRRDVVGASCRACPSC